MKGRFAPLVAILLAVATLGVAQPARAIAWGPFALAFGLDMIRNQASQPVEQSTVGMPYLSANVHTYDCGRDFIMGGANLGTQGLVVSAGCVLEIEPQLPAKPNLSDMQAITIYSMRGGFPNLALVRPDFKGELLKELGLRDGEDEHDCDRPAYGRAWSRDRDPTRRSYRRDQPSERMSRLRNWDIVEVDDYLGWLIWLDTRDLNGYYIPAVDLYFRNGTVPTGFLNLCRKPKNDSIRSVTNLAVLRPDEVEAGLNSPAVQRALEFFNGQCYVPPMVQPTFRVTNPEVAAMIAEGQGRQQPPAPRPPVGPPMMYPLPGPLGPQMPDQRPVPPFPTEGRDGGPRQPPVMPGGQDEESNYWEQQVPVPQSRGALLADDEQALCREAAYFGYTGELLQQGSFQAKLAEACPYPRRGLSQPVDIFIVENGKVLCPITVEVEIDRGGKRWSQTFTAPQGIQILSGLEPGDGLRIDWNGRTIWQGQMQGPGRGLWLPVLLDESARRAA